MIYIYIYIYKRKNRINQTYEHILNITKRIEKCSIIQRRVKGIDSMTASHKCKHISCKY
uniref:Uncharacterized protein n=1 Tax=Heterorhabditis bacteriophora TaxID=37862 RepID=A0A1I7W6V6_HETBA